MHISLQSWMHCYWQLCLPALRSIQVYIPCWFEIQSLKKPVQPKLMPNMFCSQCVDLLQHLLVPMNTFVSTEKTRVWLLWQWKWKARNLLVNDKFSDRLMKITDTDLYSKETLPIHLCLLFLEKMTWTQASQPYKINEFNKLKIMVMIWGRLKFTKQPLFLVGVSTVTF